MPADTTKPRQPRKRASLTRRAKTDKLPNGMRYYGMDDGVPQSIPKGRVLAHNHVLHTRDMEIGVNGFRCWTWPKSRVPSYFKPCKCGWSGLPHYRREETKRDEAQADRCISQAQLDALDDRVTR